MNSLDLAVLTQARAWRAAGQAVWLVTVVETWGSAPRSPGALLAVCGDGSVSGSVSGGCVEDDLIHRVRHGERVGAPTVLRYGVSKAEAARFGLPCGGNLVLLQEPLRDMAWVDDVLQRAARREVVVRTLDVDSGRITTGAGQRGDVFSFDGTMLRSVFGPRWRLLLVGAGPVSQTLAAMASALDFDVVCCDPRDAYESGWDVPGTTFTRGMPDDVATGLGLDAHCAVAALSHDPKLDDLVLLEALKSPAFYVGALGSRRHTAERRARLALFDLTPQQIERLHGPIGLHLGGNSPGEIAVSVMAEIIAVRHGVPLAQKKPAHVGAAA